MNTISNHSMKDEVSKLLFFLSKLPEFLEKNNFESPESLLFLGIYVLKQGKKVCKTTGFHGYKVDVKVFNFAKLLKYLLQGLA